MRLFQLAFNIGVVAVLVIQWRLNKQMVQFVRAQQRLNKAVLAVHKAIVDK